MSQIKAKVILRSAGGYEGHDVVTFELEYPRFIHAEFMTHRVFSRNAASSRAIPVKVMLEQVRTNPAQPVHWGKNQAGMQADNCFEGKDKAMAQAHWVAAANSAADHAEMMQDFGLHKQVANRVLEPFQMMKVVMTTTELDNFKELRLHKDAQPEIQELARVMFEALEAEEYPYAELTEGYWHLPYVGHVGEAGHLTSDGKESISLEDCKKLSASLCAQVSYRKADESVDKALMIYDKLVTMRPVHASPFEHQATIIPYFNEDCLHYEDVGVTHEDQNKVYWSGNLRGFVQWRQLITTELGE